MSAQRRPSALTGRVALFVVLALAAFVPVGGSQSRTLVGFRPGAPDPNWYTSHAALGYPVTWLHVVHVVNEAERLNYWTGRVANPLFPLAACLVVLFLPPAVAGLGQSPPDRRLWRLAGAGCGGVAFAAAYSLTANGGMPDLPADPFATAATLVGGGIGDWAAGRWWEPLPHPPAATTPPAA